MQALRIRLRAVLALAAAALKYDVMATATAKFSPADLPHLPIQLGIPDQTNVLLLLTRFILLVSSILLTHHYYYHTCDHLLPHIAYISLHSHCISTIPYHP